MTDFADTIDVSLGQVLSTGFPEGVAFELKLNDSNVKGLKSGAPANVLAVLSGVAVPARENPEPQEKTHVGVFTVDTEYSLRPGDELCGAAAYVTLASIANDDELDQIGIGLEAVHVAANQASGAPPKLRVVVESVGLLGDVTVDRFSYQAYVAIYRPNPFANWQELDDNPATVETS